MIMGKYFYSITVLVMQAMLCQVAFAVEPDEVLKLAEDAGRWITSTAANDESAGVWPDDALAPDAISYDLASGAAGKVVFFSALYEASGNEDYLRQARRGADFLVDVLKDPAQLAGNPRRASLYTGVSGIGVALLNVQRQAPDDKYEMALLRVLDLLSEWSIAADRGVHWSEQYNDLIYGDAGTALFLAQVAQQTGNADALALARRGAHFLLSEAHIDDGTRYWRFRRDKEFNLPNFSHGTAGVVYVLATIAELTDDQELIEGAMTGFEYVRSIAEIDNERLRLPYGWGSEGWDGLYEFGWAHGVSGTSLMFMRMQNLDINRQDAAALLTLAKNTLTSINLPEKPAAPFAEPSTPLDFRFGRAGVLGVASHWASQQPNERAMTELRDGLFVHIRSMAIREGDLVHWEADVPAFMGGGRAAYTGLFHGAAGIGLALLHMHASMVGESHYASLPDDPLSAPPAR